MKIKIKINELMTQLIIICSLVMLAFTGLIGIDNSKYCLFLIMGLCIAKIFFLHVKGKQLGALLITLLSLAWMFFIHNEAVANQLIFFGSLILAIDLFHNGIEQSTWKLLKVCTIIACVWLLLESRSSGAEDFRGRIVLSFKNPNMTGIALSAPAMVLILMLAEEKRIGIRLLYVVLTAMMTHLIYRTENRGSFFSLLGFALCALLACSRKKALRITSKTVYAVLKLMPVIAMLIYVYLFTVLPSDLELLGKPFFSGRESGWKIALEQLFRNPFKRYTFEDGTLNLFLEGVRRYGILSMISYFFLLFSFKKRDLKETSRVRYLAYLGFHILMFQQSFESTLITGSYSVYVWTYILLGVASMKTADFDNDRDDKRARITPVEESL